MISHESIYKYIYSIHGQKIKLFRSLMYQRPKRQYHFARKHHLKVPDQFLIANRPEFINSREQFGHFEGDLTFLKGSNSANLLVLLERVTRKTFIFKNNNKKSISTMNKIYSVFNQLPLTSRQTITFDNGTEFRKFGVLQIIGTKTYFCKPAAPWQKGAIERVNAQLHKFIPKSTNILNLDEISVIHAQDQLNNLPRKCLNYLTPEEMWVKYCSSTVALQT